MQLVDAQTTTIASNGRIFTSPVVEAQRLVRPLKHLPGNGRVLPVEAPPTCLPPSANSPVRSSADRQGRRGHAAVSPGTRRLRETPRRKNENVSYYSAHG